MQLPQDQHRVIDEEAVSFTQYLSPGTLYLRWIPKPC